MALLRKVYRDKRTGEQKRTTTWSYEFHLAGKLIRESAHTTRKTIAAEAEKRRRLELERALAGIPAVKPETRIRSVSEALKSYAKAYKVNHRAKSTRLVEDRSVHLERILGSLLLPDITEGRVLDYMERRQKEAASNRTINLELGVLSRAMGQKWSAVWPKISKLEENTDVGKALEPEQREAILEVAARNPSPLIYPYLMILTWTGMRDGECRHVKWERIDFEADEVIVGKAKTEKGRGRAIPMSGELRTALEQHRARYMGWFGRVDPHWYVFPFSNRRKPVDPERPVTSFKKAWTTVRSQAGVDCRLHDLRHTFCTELGEADTPESTMLDMMGHISPTMLRRYSHIRARARREAIRALELRKARVTVPPVSPPVEVFRGKRMAASS
jgi:integrase